MFFIQTDLFGEPTKSKLLEEIINNRSEIHTSLYQQLEIQFYAFIIIIFILFIMNIIQGYNFRKIKKKLQDLHKVT